MTAWSSLAQLAAPMDRSGEILGLASGENVESQRRNARRQRAAWVVMGLVVVAGLAGLFGSGPLSDGRARAGALQLEYERFARRFTDTSLRFEVAASAGDELRLWLGSELLEHLDLDSLEPMPSAAELGDDGVTYSFRVAQSDGPFAIVFNARPAHIGRVTGRAALAGGEALEWTQLVYP